MAKGRHLKAAERACAGKARFETAYEAERTAEWRFRAYPCPVCHQFHLTSRPGPTETQPLPPPADPKGPKLADLDWSAALEPKAKPARPPKAKRAPINPPPPPAPPPVLATCLDAPGKDRRVRLLIDGRLVKSAPVNGLQIVKGDVVEVAPESNPPRILRRADQPS